MKITCSILGLTAGVALLLTSGCGKEQPPSGETPKAMNPAPSETQKAADAQKPATAPAPAATEPSQAVSAAASQTEAATAAAAAPATTNTQVQVLIDKAKGLVTNQKYQDALSVVQQLSSQKLTSDQQTLVDGLKAQIQAALAKSTATDAASALGNVLGGKK